MTHIHENVPLADKTYYRMGGFARYFTQPQSLEHIQGAVLWAKAQNLPIALLGSGSNCVFADGEFSGLVISLERFAAWHWETPDFLYAEAGVTNTEIAEICLNAERTGASWMYRMPGQLGATVRMNARCYGGEISQIVHEVTTLDTTGVLHTYAGSELFLGYKNTLLMQRPEIVVAVRLRLHTYKCRAELLAHMEQCEQDRHGKHHFDLPSCGSTFKNNYAVGKPSGRVFDECGLKDAHVGNARVSLHHANFVWNTGNARTHDMLELAAHMRKKALEIANADLELEVQPIGAFANELFDRLALGRLGPHFKSNAQCTWTGLLWHPLLNAEQKNAQDSLTHSEKDSLTHSEKDSFKNSIDSVPENFPASLFSGIFLEYFRKPLSGLPEVGVEVRQLLGLRQAQAQPQQPFLEWETRVPCASVSTIFPLAPQGDPQFTDELWNFSVSEIFFGQGTEAVPYLEFEMTPQGHWIALALTSARVRALGHAVPSARHWPGVVVAPVVLPEENNLDSGQNNNLECFFKMTFSFETLAQVVTAKGELRLQCALSLGNSRYFIAPHWKHSFSDRETWDNERVPQVQPDFHQPSRFWRVFLKQ